jgi:hypothetical protein
MSVVPQENQVQSQEAQKPSDKELNFRKQEEMFKRQLDQERQARITAEEKIAQLVKQHLPTSDDDDDDSDEPYVDKRRLKKELGKVVKQANNDTDSKIQAAVQQALAGERQQNWLKANPDFYDIMQHAQTFAEKDPELAETILSMPEGFERQKLVYKNIKALGIHKKEEPKSNIQDKIDANRRTPGYQPSGVGSAPYGVVSIGRDVSPTEGKNAYAKMQELKARMRL